MKRLLPLLLAAIAATSLVACFGSRYISANADLEAIYVGKTYYEIVDDFGRPDASINDGMEGTRVAYNAVSLGGTRAAGLYSQYKMRNRTTKVVGMPVGGLTFSFDSEMRCYAVDSDFQRERTKEAPEPKKQRASDPRRPNPIKPQIPRTVEFPYYKDCSPYAELVSIEKVDVQREYTRIYFQYRDRTPNHRPLTDAGIYIMPDAYIEDCATGTRCALTDNEGINLYPERSYFAHNQGGYDVLVYSLTFQPLPEQTEFINIIEPGHSGFNFYNVDIRTPLTTKEQLRQMPDAPLAQ